MLRGDCEGDVHLAEEGAEEYAHPLCGGYAGEGGLQSGEGAEQLRDLRWFTLVRREWRCHH